MSNPFEYQKPDENQVEKIKAVRQACDMLYGDILNHVPAGAERVLAIRKLEECSMWANKAILFPAGYAK